MWMFDGFRDVLGGVEICAQLAAVVVSVLAVGLCCSVASVVHQPLYSPTFLEDLESLGLFSVGYLRLAGACW
jgi:hypothetical protein